MTNFSPEWWWPALRIDELARVDTAMQPDLADSAAAAVIEEIGELLGCAHAADATAASAEITSCLSSYFAPVSLGSAVCWLADPATRTPRRSTAPWWATPIPSHTESIGDVIDAIEYSGWPIVGSGWKLATPLLVEAWDAQRLSGDELHSALKLRSLRHAILRNDGAIQLLLPAFEQIAQLTYATTVMELQGKETDLEAAVQKRLIYNGQWLEGKPGLVREVRTILRNWRRTVRSLSKSLDDAPVWVHVDDESRFDWEPGDVHRGGLPVVTVTNPVGGAVWHPRQLSGLAIFAELLESVDPEHLSALRTPKFVVDETGGWVDFVEDRPMESGSEEIRLRALAELACLLGRFRCEGFEVESLCWSGSHLVVTQIDGVAAGPVRPDASWLDSAEDWADLLFAGEAPTRDLLGAVWSAGQLEAGERVLASFRKTRSRTFVRNTIVYAKMLQLLSHPQFVNDGVRQSLLLLRLRVVPKTVHSAAAVALTRSEISDLEQRDIPYFTSTTSSDSVFAGPQSEIIGALKVPESTADDSPNGPQDW